MTRAAPIEPDWLALREAADTAARAVTLDVLLPALVQYLGSRRADRPVRVVDVGAGTGAGARWLRPHLPGPQQWRLVDHDERLLSLAAADGRAVLSGVRDLPALLAEEPADLVTCQALLDLLTPAEVEVLVAAAAASGGAVLLGLTVTGDVTLEPPDPLDAVIGAAFDAHQRRDGRLGPGAASHTADALRRNGFTVTTAATPWRLGPGTGALLDAWVEGRAAAAADQEPALDVLGWRARRREQAANHSLTAVVGHVDVLGLPAGYS